jgi:hypothetical protein
MPKGVKGFQRGKARTRTSWPKGKSGNPGGRTKKSKEIEALCQKLLDKAANKNKATEGLLAIAEDVAHTKAQDRIHAWELLMAYAYGRPRQRTEVSGSDEQPLRVVVLPDNGR